MDEQLVSLLDYEGVLGVLATTSDGLVIAAAGLSGEDADVVAAAGTSLLASRDADDERGSSAEIAGGAIHLFAGTEISLVLLTEAGIPREAVVELMEDSLNEVGSALA